MITVENKKDAIQVIQALAKQFNITYDDVNGEKDTSLLADRMSKKYGSDACPVSNSMLIELLCHLNTASDTLEERYKTLTYEKKSELVDKGCLLAKDAADNGTKLCYYGNDELALYCVMKAVGFQ